MFQNKDFRYFLNVKEGMQSMRSQRGGHDSVTKLTG